MIVAVNPAVAAACVTAMKATSLFISLPCPMTSTGARGHPWILSTIVPQRFCSGWPLRTPDVPAEFKSRDGWNFIDAVVLEFAGGGA